MHQLLTVLWKNTCARAQDICTSDSEAEHMNQDNSTRAEEGDDLAAIFIDAGSDFRVLISQTGLSDFYTLRLGTKPTADVTVNVKPVEGLEFNPSQVIFRVEDWHVQKKVRVTADAVTGSNVISNEFIISHAALSQDPQYGEKYATFKPSTILATVLDDDAPFLFGFGSNQYGQLGLNAGEQVDIPTLMDSDAVANALINRRKSARKAEDTKPVVPHRNSKNNKKINLKSKDSKTHEHPRKSDTIDAIQTMLAYQDEHHAKGLAISESDQHDNILHSPVRTYMDPSSYIAYRRTESVNIHDNRLLDQRIAKAKAVQRHERDELYMETLNETNMVMQEMTRASEGLHPSHANPYSSNIKRRPKSFLNYLEERRNSIEVTKHTKTLGLFNTMSAGQSHSAFLTDRGKCYLMGRNDKGQVAREEHTNFKVPVKWNGYDVHKSIHRNIVSICCGESHTILVTSGGLVLSFGSGLNGRLGHGK